MVAQYVYIWSMLLANKIAQTRVGAKELWADNNFYFPPFIGTHAYIHLQSNKIGIPSFFCYNANSSGPSHSLSVAPHHLEGPPPAHCGFIGSKGMGK